MQPVSVPVQEVDVDQAVVVGCDGDLDAPVPAGEVPDHVRSALLGHLEGDVVVQVRGEIADPAPCREPAHLVPVLAQVRGVSAVVEDLVQVVRDPAQPVDLVPDQRQVPDEDVQGGVVHGQGDVAGVSRLVRNGVHGLALQCDEERPAHADVVIRADDAEHLVSADAAQGDDSGVQVEAQHAHDRFDGDVRQDLKPDPRALVEGLPGDLLDIRHIFSSLLFDRFPCRTGESNPRRFTSAVRPVPTHKRDAVPDPVPGC